MKKEMEKEMKITCEKSKIEALETRLDNAAIAYKELRDKYNAAVTRLNNGIIAYKELRDKYNVVVTRVNNATVATTVVTCEKCGRHLTAAQVSYCERNMGGSHLCFACQHGHAHKEAAATTTTVATTTAAATVQDVLAQMGLKLNK